MNLAAIRKEFPVYAEYAAQGRPLHYLDSAATSLKPECVMRAMDCYYRECPANVHRATYSMAEEATERYENTRLAIQRLINARQVHEILFTHGTTEALNLVAHSWAAAHMRPGERILLTEMEHHSNLIPWRLLARERQLNISYAPLNNDGSLHLEAFATLLTPDVKLCSFTLMSNVLGIVNPAQDLIRLARERGIRVCLDAAQAIAHIPVDVQSLDCDFLAFSGHKMFAPTGTGVLYVREKHLEQMTPFLGGGDMISSVTLEKETWAEPPYKFEAGTPDVAGIIGLGAAVDFMQQLDWKERQAQEQALTIELETGLKTIKGLRILADGHDHHGLVSFTIDGVHPHDVAHFADQAGVSLRAGYLCAQPLIQRLGLTAVCRASLSVYNNSDDISALIEALSNATRFFHGC